MQSVLSATPVPALLGSVGISDALAWIAIGAFMGAAFLQWRDAHESARALATAAWVAFGVFWITKVPYYYHDVQSPLETLLALAALPLCLYAGYLLWNGRDSLFILTRAVAFMGLIYLPAETIPFVRAWLIETAASQTRLVMDLLGYNPTLVEGAGGYQSTFAFESETVTGLTINIVIACTGIGAMSIFGGLIAAVKAPLKRKVAAFAMAVGIIWVLNLARNVFIGLATPMGWFQQDWVVSFMTTYMGAEASRVSFLVSHNYVAQTLSIVALIGITYILVEVLPEILEPIEEVLFVLTNAEYDLVDAFGDGAGEDGDD